MRKHFKPLIAALVVGQVFTAAAATRDLATRTDDQLRGGKKFWRVFVWLNPGNSAAYWLVGRR